VSLHLERSAREVRAMNFGDVLGAVGGLPAWSAW
jgi:hypothetical protein